MVRKCLELFRTHVSWTRIYAQVCDQVFTYSRVRP